MKKTDADKRRQPEQTAALSITKNKGTKAPELLAPAGELAGVIGAVNAGADAVYLGAEAFSARAYAKNLNPQELLQALDYAHAFGRKIYLACNILLRDPELEQIPGILDPLYERGLDGIIVQDLGLLAFLHERYPSLPLHASTQMAVLSAAGAEWLKRLHVSRVVPGRELALEELAGLKARGIEVECFIHGAMCYSYSGRCLLSSFAGGRSGNRGRCAGPCRQPYHLPGERSQYLLSMKDMWSLHEIGALIDAGIDSFKIEGRMKAPEYTAGVTAVYRKYIDRYMSCGSAEVTEEDRLRLERLYLRSGKQEGYLHRHNSRDMISLSSPAYGKVSEEEKKKVFSKYLAERQRIPVRMQCRIFAGEPVQLSVRTDAVSLTVKGAPAETARKNAMTEEQFREKLSKTGDTLFAVTDCAVYTDHASFVPVGKLNELRRNALEKLQGRLCPQRTDVCEAAYPEIKETEASAGVETPVLRVGLRDTASLPGLLSIPQIEGLILELDAVSGRDGAELASQIHTAGKRMYLRLPDILRQKHADGIRTQLQQLAVLQPDGIYLNGIDALGVTDGLFPKERLFGDTGLYVFNRNTERLLQDHVCSYTVSPERAGKEYRSLLDAGRSECLIYGYLPVMYSANCIQNTLHGCEHKAGLCHLEDGKGHRFPVALMHRYCYNIVYNCVPLSLQDELQEFRRRGAAAVYRLEFSIETPEEVLRIAQGYADLWDGKEADLAFLKGKTTRGHFARGAE